MTLDIGQQIVGYNNEIMVATSNLTIGYNEQINSQIIPHTLSTNEKVVVLTQTQDKPTTSTKANTSPPASEPAAPAQENTSAQDHNDNKMLILLGLLFGGGAFLMFRM